MSSGEAGFTLTELMAVIAILAVLAAVAVPALTRDSVEGKLNGFVQKLNLDLLRAKTESMASREDRSVIIDFNNRYYTVSSVIPGTVNFAELKRVTYTSQTTDVRIAGVTQGLDMHAIGVASGRVEIRFLASGSILLDLDGTIDNTLTQASVTIFVDVEGVPEELKLKRRLIVHGTTAFIEQRDTW